MGSSLYYYGNPYRKSLSLFFYLAGYSSRKQIIKKKGIKWFQEKFLHQLTTVSIIALLATSAVLFGLASGSSLATVVGVLVEVPIMLMLVKICLTTRNWFKR